MTHHQMYKVSSLLFFIWTMCFGLSLLEIRLDYLFHDAPMWPLLFLAIFVFIYCFQPCIQCGYRRTRWQICITIKEMAIAPFGRVRFRDFFFTDVVTSLVKPMEDFAVMIYYMIHITEVNDHDDHGKYEAITVWFGIISIAPYWWRMW